MHVCTVCHGEITWLLTSVRQTGVNDDLFKWPVTMETLHTKKKEEEEEESKAEGKSGENRREGSGEGDREEVEQRERMKAVR